MKQFLAFLTSIMIFIGFSPVALAPPDENPAADKGPLTKIVFIHYEKGFSHKPNHKPSGGVGGVTCYTLLSNGAKWKAVENAQVNPTSSGLSSDFLVNSTLVSREIWDDQTSAEIFGNNITVNETADWDGDAGDLPDNMNEYVFADYDSTAIAVTTVWGYFFGPPQTREIIEYDVLFNTNYTWGDSDVTGNSTMDYSNIAVHETGHGAGLGDIYDTSCGEVTMYGYSDYGETKKRTLESQDIKGLQKLYGA